MKGCGVADNFLSGDWWTSVSTLIARFFSLAPGRSCFWLNKRGTCLFITSIFLHQECPKTFTLWSSGAGEVLVRLEWMLSSFLGFCEASGVQLMPSGAEFPHRSICCLQNLAHLWDPTAGLGLSCIKFHKEVWVKVSSLGVAELLKMCLALYVWVIPTSPSTRAVRSAITQDNRSHSEQNVDVFYRELFYNPFSIGSIDWCPCTPVICRIRMGFGCCN